MKNHTARSGGMAVKRHAAEDLRRVTKCGSSGELTLRIEPKERVPTTVE